MHSNLKTLFVASLFASPVDAQDFLVDPSQTVEKIHYSCVVGDTPQDQALCGAYALGVLDSIIDDQSLFIAVGNMDKVFVCVPKKINSETARFVVASWFARNTELIFSGAVGAPFAIRLAFIEAFPCDKFQ